MHFRQLLSVALQFCAVVSRDRYYLSCKCHGNDALVQCEATAQHSANYDLRNVKDRYLRQTSLGCRVSAILTHVTIQLKSTLQVRGESVAQLALALPVSRPSRSQTVAGFDRRNAVEENTHAKGNAVFKKN
jgi:hypothetical protein